MESYVAVLFMNSPCQILQCCSVVYVRVCKVVLFDVVCFFCVGNSVLRFDLRNGPKILADLGYKEVVPLAQLDLHSVEWRSRGESGFNRIMEKCLQSKWILKMQ